MFDHRFHFVLLCPYLIISCWIGTRPKSNLQKDVFPTATSEGLEIPQPKTCKKKKESYHKVKSRKFEIFKQATVDLKMQEIQNLLTIHLKII